ncbi:hypothetical protein [Pandoraea apista]|uniref:Uncharacterized protein n=1 Tax=Pandoraea apista TaxID=93218 RepID=A0A5E5P1W0_9BURK|nr:hypothetical protein [Pandoraea apista]VVG70686.1 hypothetical protein PAP18089_01650 [Pandoraea apista]
MSRKLLCVLAGALVAAATPLAQAADATNLLGGYTLLKDGKAVGGFGVVMVAPGGLTADHASITSNGAAEVCVKKTPDTTTTTTTAIGIETGHRVNFAVEKYDAGHAKVRADVTVMEQTGEGTYRRGNCMVTGPIVKTISKTLVFDLVSGDTGTKDVGEGYALSYGFVADN